MRLGALIGWGIVIYAVMFLAWNMFAINGYTTGIAPRISLILILIVTALIAGRSLRFRSWSDVLPYSFAWAVIAAACDAATGVSIAGWGIFSDWHLWLGYALIVVIPLFAPLTLAVRHPEVATD